MFLFRESHQKLINAEPEVRGDQGKSGEAKIAGMIIHECKVLYCLEQVDECEMGLGCVRDERVCVEREWLFSAGKLK